MQYRIELTPDDNDTLLVTCPALPEVVTFGEDRADAVRHARDAIEEALASRMADGEGIPAGDCGTPGYAMVRPYLGTQLKAQLYTTLRTAGITRAELARRLGWHRESVDRLFRLDHASRLDQIEAAFAALGLVVEIQVRAE